MYKRIVNQIAMPRNKALWKLKVPLKVKIFVWFLIKGVILTKDNFLKWNWKGDEKCYFCNNKETIQHLFFECHVARFIWRIAHIAFGLQPPRDMTSFFFQTWLQHLHSKLQPQIRVGASTIFWSIWLTWNDVIFDKKNNIYSYLQRTAH